MIKSIVTFEQVKEKKYPLSNIFCEVDHSYKKANGLFKVNRHQPAYVPEYFVLSAYIDRPDWMKKGLSQTASGYGSKLVTQYKVSCQNGKTYRVYCRCYSNAGTLYILIGGYEKIIDGWIIDSKLERLQCH